MFKLRKKVETCSLLEAVRAAAVDWVQCIQLFFSDTLFALILKDWFLIRFPPNYGERFLMSSASPKFVFWGPKIKSFVLNRFK